jgi:hypothetical protein
VIFIVSNVGIGVIIYLSEEAGVAQSHSSCSPNYFHYKHYKAIYKIKSSKSREKNEGYEKSFYWNCVRNCFLHSIHHWAKEKREMANEAKKGAGEKIIVRCPSFTQMWMS